MHSWLVAVEARNLTRSSVHCCIRAMFTGEGGRSRTARHELLKMVPNTDDAAALVRACFELPCTLRENAPSRRSVDTYAAGANAADFLPKVVVSAGEALHSGTAVGEVVSSTWPKDCTADTADVLAVVTADRRCYCCCHGSWLRPRPSSWRLVERLPWRPRPRVPPPAPVRPLHAWATASAWAEALLLS